jgi:hypothetical protein
MLVFSSPTSLEAIKICMPFKRFAQRLQIPERLSSERMDIPDNSVLSQSIYITHFGHVTAV